MNKLFATLSSLMLVMSTSALAATAPQNKEDLSNQPLEKIAPWPLADKGMTRQVIYLPPKENEENLKVELLIGKTLNVDCNRQMLSATLKNETLAGWGYDYLVVDRMSEPASTMMACPDNSRHPMFVAANIDEESFQEYDSRVPIVIYVPEGTEVKYRIWHAEETISQAIEK